MGDRRPPGTVLPSTADVLAERKLRWTGDESGLLWNAFVLQDMTSGEAGPGLYKGLRRVALFFPLRLLPTNSLVRAAGGASSSQESSCQRPTTEGRVLLPRWYSGENMDDDEALVQLPLPSSADV